MAKLYWRMKKNGKWTWKAVCSALHVTHLVDECSCMEEEEE